MSSEKIIDALFDNNLEKFRTEVRTALYTKAGEYMNGAKQVVANSMMNSPEEVQEELKGNQHKIDANKNGKIDARDFKLLRAKKNVKEGYAYPEGEVHDECFEICHEKHVHGKGGKDYHDAFESCVKNCKKG